MLTLAELRADIRRRLGGSKVCVELTDADIDSAITQALDQLTRYFPGESLAAISSSPSQTRYVISHRLLIGVTDVFFMNPQQASDRITDNPFLNVNILGNEMVWEAGGAEIYLQLGYIEDLRRILSSHPEWQGLWEYNETTGKQEYALYMDLPVGFTEYYTSYRFIWGYEASDSRDRGLPAVRRTFEAWVRDYARAEARELLGDIRNKFGGIPQADGGVSEIDGDSQITRAREDKDKLLEDMENRQRQIPVIIV